MNAGRATHAVKLISDDEYLKLNRLIFKAHRRIAIKRGLLNVQWINK